MVLFKCYVISAEMNIYRGQGQRLDPYSINSDKTKVHFKFNNG